MSDYIPYSNIPLPKTPGGLPKLIKDASSELFKDAATQFRYEPPKRLLTEITPELLKPGRPLILPEGYQYVLLTGFTGTMLVLWKYLRFALARYHNRIPCPLTYSNKCMIFNRCYRPYDSTIQLFPQFLFLLCVGGIEMPYTCSVGGLIWIFGRLRYAVGYYTGEPDQKANGSYYVLGHFMLWMATLRFAVKRLIF